MNEHDADQPMTDEEEARLQAEIAADRDALARHYLSLAVTGDEPDNNAEHPY